MSWAKFDDRATSNPKVKLLGDVAFRLWVSSICHCCEQLTDGQIDREIPAILPRAPSGAKLKAAIAELVSRGLWEVVEGGWEVHDFHDWNPSSEQVRAKKQARSEAGRRGGQNRGKATSKPEAIASPVAKQTESKIEPRPRPRPRPEDPKDRSVDPRPLDSIEEPPLDTPVFCPGEILNHDTIIAISAALGVSEAAIRAGLREFVSYWTIGAGAGRRHSLAKWRAKAREDVRQKAGRGLLIDPTPPSPTELHPEVHARLAARQAAEDAADEAHREKLLAQHMGPATADVGALLRSVG